MGDFTHFDKNGNAVMVDVSNKTDTVREAYASGEIVTGENILKQIKDSENPKGDVLNVARIAGIMACKRTGELIPMCHNLMLTKCSLDFEVGTDRIRALCKVKTTGKTGVEMEALTGVQIALLTIYDMCKALDKGMYMTNIRLLYKSGGKSGVYCLEESEESR